MTITYKLAAAAILLGATAIVPACSTPQMQAAGTIASSAVQVAQEIDPSISPAVALACAAAAPKLAALA